MDASQLNFLQVIIIWNLSRKCVHLKILIDANYCTLGHTSVYI